MVRNRQGPPHQSKHFQPEDHAHAAHQEEASYGQAHRPGRVRVEEGKSQSRKTDQETGHPSERTPQGPSKGQ